MKSVRKGSGTYRIQLRRVEMPIRRVEKASSSGRSKRARCKLSFAKSRSRELPCLRRSGYAQAGEILRSEAYLAVRRNDACAPKRFSVQAMRDEGCRCDE